MGGIKHQPQRLASLKCKQGPLSHFLQSQSQVGTLKSLGHVSAQGEHVRQRGWAAWWLVSKMSPQNPTLFSLGDLEEEVALVSSLGSFK